MNKNSKYVDNRKRVVKLKKKHTDFPKSCKIENENKC